MSAEWALARFVWRRNRTGALIWGAVFALVNVVSAFGFAATFPDEASRQAFARSVEGGGGLDVIFGQAHEAATMAGFVAWRSVLTNAVMAGLWGFLRGTSMLRGEEDANRWEVVLAAPTTPLRATRATLAGLGLACLTLFAVNAGLDVAFLVLGSPDLPLAGVLHLALVQALPAAFFMALGALASQLSATRSQASSLCGAVLGLSFVVRIIADEASGQEWLAWILPLGWTERTLALTEDRLLPDLLYAAAIAALAWGTLALSHRRDLGASTFARQEQAAPRSAGLTGPFGLDLRVQRGRILAWSASLFAAGALFGWLSRSVGDTIAELSSQQGFGRVVQAISSDAGAIAFLDAGGILAAVAVMMLAAGQVSLVRQEEETGRLDNLLVRPVTRAGWLAARCAVGLAAALAAGLCMGVGGWAGARVQGVDVGLPRMLEAGLNSSLAAMVVLGIGLLVFGVAPRLASAAAYGVAASSFLVGVVGAALNPPQWVLRLSLLQHLGSVPSGHIRWPDAAWMLALAVDAVLLGAYAFSRRDIVAE